MANLTRYSPRRSPFYRRGLTSLDPFFWDYPSEAAWWDPLFTRPYCMLNRLAAWDIDGAGKFFLGDNLAVDLYEKGDQLVVKAALPGVHEDDVEVIEQEGVLTIRAKNAAEVEQTSRGWHIRGQRYSAWQRTLSLPVEVNTEHAQAGLKDGILTVLLPKREPHMKLFHRIKVKTPKIKLPSFVNKPGKLRISHN